MRNLIKNGMLSLMLIFLITAGFGSCSAGEPGGDVILIEEESEFYDYINDETPVLVDFYADWCRPCKVQGPIVEELSTELKGEVHVLKLNVDNFPRIASKFQVRSIPTSMIFIDGKQVWKAIGLQQKASLQEAINKHTAKKENK
jgi:thioredoxin 1